MMKRFTTLVMVAVVGSLALHAGTALANNKNSGNHNSMQKQTPKKVNNSNSQNKKCKTCDKKCDKGDKNCGTKPPVIVCNPKPPICGTGMPGTIVGPVKMPPIWTVGGTTIVRDHRPIKSPITPGNGQGGVTVTPVSGFGPIVRDHRGLKGTTSPTLGLGTVKSIGNGLEHAAGSAVKAVEHGLSGVEHAAGSVASTLGHSVATVGSDIGHAASGAVDAVGDFFGF